MPILLPLNFSGLGLRHQKTIAFLVAVLAILGVWAYAATPASIFPNMTLLANADHLTVMTTHPGPDPDHGELVMMLWTRMPPGAARCRPADVRTTADEAEPGLVLTQDISVLAGLQRGLHQPGYTHLTLSNEERRVINLHRNLERYLDLPESERMTGGETDDGTG